MKASSENNNNNTPPPPSTITDVENNNTFQKELTSTPYSPINNITNNSIT